MKRTLLFFILLLTFAWPSSGGQVTQSLTFDDLGLGGGGSTSGTYNSNDTFSFDVLLSFQGYSASSLSFWLETNTAFAGSLSITGVTYGTTFPDPNSLSPNPALFNSGAGADPGYLSESRDLGSAITSFANAPGPGTYFVAHVTFAITGAAPGTYDLASTTLPNRISEVTSFDGTTFADHNLPASHYTITIVPEPATLGLLGLGAIGLMATLLRRAKHYGNALPTI
jgi:hypothetical protein